jgi:hypothetical protein
LEQRKPQLLDEAAEVIADGGEHGVDRIAGGMGDKPLNSLRIIHGRTKEH